LRITSAYILASSVVMVVHLTLTLTDVIEVRKEDAEANKYKPEDVVPPHYKIVHSNANKGRAFNATTLTS